MVFFRDLNFADPPTIFLALESPSYYPGLRIGQFHIPPLAGNAIRKAPEFTFAFGNPYGFTSSYNGLDLPYAAGAPDDRTAFRRLMKKIDDHGFDVQVEGPESYIIGHYIGPNGGVNPVMKDVSLKKGDKVHTRGIVIRTKQKPKEP